MRWLTYRLSAVVETLHFDRVDLSFGKGVEADGWSLRVVELELQFTGPHQPPLSLCLLTSYIWEGGGIRRFDIN